MPNADRVLEIEAAAEQGNNVDTEEQEYYRYIHMVRNLGFGGPIGNPEAVRTVCATVLTISN